VYDANDRVYASRNDGYVCLYDFNLQSGDTLWIPMEECSAPLGYAITETGIVDIEGKSLRFQRARLLPYHASWDDQITMLILERMGVVAVQYFTSTEQIDGYFFLDEQYNCLTDQASRGFRCYADTDINEYNPANIDCDFVVSSREPVEALRLQVQPNPADQFCRVQLFSTGERWQYRLYDPEGRLQRQGSGNSATLWLDTAPLPPGMYFLQVHANGKRASQALLVQH
jgi:hypothetical protein